MHTITYMYIRTTVTRRPHFTHAPILRSILFYFYMHSSNLLAELPEEVCNLTSLRVSFLTITACCTYIYIHNLKISTLS